MRGARLIGLCEVDKVSVGVFLGLILGELELVRVAACGVSGADFSFVHARTT